jgi:hypothetical protein
MPAGTLTILPSASVSLTRSGNLNGPYDVLDNAGLLKIDHASFSTGEGWRIDNQQGGTFQMVGGTVTLAISSFTNAGVIDLESGARMTGSWLPTSNFLIGASGSVLVDSTSQFSLTNQFTGGTLTNAGLISVTGGTVSTSLALINNSGTIRASGGRVALSYPTMTNSGLIDLSGPVVATFDGGFNNGATASILIGASASGSISDSGATFSNQGLLSTDHAAAASVNFRSIVNNGTIRAVAGPLILSFQTATNSGVIDLQAGATASFQGTNGLNLAAGSSLLMKGATASMLLST